MRNNLSFIVLALALTLSVTLSSCAKKKVSADEMALRNKTASVNIQLGMKYLERNDIQRAKRKLMIALEQSPELPEAWYAMGYYLESTNNIKASEKYYLKALQLAPNRGDVQNNYGTHLCRVGQYHKAIEHFKKAAADPGYLDIASAYENAGLCALELPDKHLAEDFFRLALSQDSQRKLAKVELSKLTKDRG